MLKRLFGITRSVAKQEPGIGQQKKPSATVDTSHQDWGRFFVRLAQIGGGEFWAYTSLLAWVVLVPAAFIAVGQAASTASSMQASIATAKSVAEIQTAPVPKVELERIGEQIKSNFPDFNMEVTDGGVIKIFSGKASSFSEWMHLMAYMPSIRKRTTWSIQEICLASEANVCPGSNAILVALKAESLVITK